MFGVVSRQGFEVKFEQPEQYEQREQYEQSKQSKQPEQCEQYEQHEQFEQSEQFEQFEQFKQFEHATKLPLFSSACSFDKPHHLFPLLSTQQLSI